MYDPIFSPIGNTFQGARLPKVSFEDLSAIAILNLDPSIIKEITSGERRTLNHNLFEELSSYGKTLEKYIPKLKKVFGESFPKRQTPQKEKGEISKQKQRYAKFFIRDLALKIVKEIEIIKKTTQLNQKNKRVILEAAANYINCRDALLVLNDPLVYHYFQLHPTTSTANKSAMDDLAQVAKYGLIKAVDGYIPELNYEFSSYAFQTIHTTVINELQKGNGIFCYSHATGDQISKIRIEANRQMAETGSYDIKKIAKKFNISPKNVANLIKVSKQPLFLSELEHQKGSTISEMASGLSPAEEAIMQETQQRKRRFALEILPVLMGALNERQRKCLELHCGFYGIKKTYDEIGQELSPEAPLSRQRVEQIVRRAEKILYEKCRRDKKLLNNIMELFFDKDGEN